MSEEWRETLLCEYECAQQSAQHHDSLLWETTSIIWGANALLLGFILEALTRDSLRSVVTLVATLGIVLQICVSLLMWANNKFMNIRYELCRAIEGGLPMIMKQHQAVQAIYKSEKWWKRFPLLSYFQRVLHTVVGIFFVAAWISVLWRAWH